jgi:predicted DNA-binding transcriptional regulator AlpA
MPSRSTHGDGDMLTKTKTARVTKAKRSPAAALADVSLKDDCLLSTAQAARALGMSAKTLRQLRCDRQGPPCLKMGTVAQSRVVYRRTDLERWIAQNATPVGGV